MAFLSKTGVARLWAHIMEKLDAKVNIEDGKGLSTNDYTTSEKTKLGTIEAGAQVNKVNSVNNKTGSITLTASDVGAATSGHTHNEATQTTAGLLSAEDKTKLTKTNIAYGTCSTAAATSAKVVNIVGNAAWELQVGSLVMVKFTYSNTASSCTLNVGGTGAKSIYYKGTAITAGVINAGDIAVFIYNGSQYHLLSVDTTLEQAKVYADTVANSVKNDLLNGAGAAYDTLKELGDLIDTNVDAIDALNDIAAGKADAEHDHAIADVTGLQTALDGKAASSHGTHVSYSTTAPVMAGTASVGSANTVARSDHKHPTDTSRASKTEFDTHNSDTTKHITSTERTTWNAKAAQTSLDSHTGNKSNPHGVTLGQLNVTATAAELNVLDGITATTTELNYVDGVTSNIQTQLDGKSASGHTHNYAGSSSTGGAATSANKLNTNAGSATQPVYFAKGIPVATTHTLSKSVPADAKFTDTTYSNATTSADGLMSSTDKEKLDGIETGAQVNPTPVTTAGNGAAFTATVSFIDSLVVGSSFVMIPHTTSTTTTPTLNVNGLGAKPIRRRLSSLPTAVQAGYSNNWLTQNKPYTIVYDGTNWIVEGMTKPAAADLYGSMKSLYTATLSTTWTAASTGFTQTVSVSGIKSTDTPVVGIVQTGTVDTDKAMIEGWALVSRITTAADSITAYCYGDAPTVALPIQLMCVR